MALIRHAAPGQRPAQYAGLGLQTALIAVSSPVGGNLERGKTGMKQIEELQGRILAAMDRINAGGAELAQSRASAQQAAAAAADTSSWEQALEEERMVNAQLEERLRVLSQRLKELEEAAPAPGAATAEDVAAMEAELELLRNEVGNTAERDALKQEVQRLKSELEVHDNLAATAKEEHLDQIEALQAELNTARQHRDEAIAKAEESAAAPSGWVDEGAQARITDLDAELHKLRLANEQLRASNAALRSANAEGLADAELVNAALEAELNGLRATQASDKAEVNAVLARLDSLLSAAPNLPEGEEV